MKNFKLRKDLSIEHNGITLYRIEALANLPNGVKKGEIGGYVEHENNLDGNAWIHDDAKVFENAQVYGGAQVYRNAKIYGNARVYGNTYVYGNARVYGNACVYRDARVYGNARVYGDAKIHGDARVYGYAQVSENARVYGYTHVYGNAGVYGRVRLFEDVKVNSSEKIINIITTETFSVTITKDYVFVGCKAYKTNEISKITKEQAYKDGLPKKLFSDYKSMILSTIKLIKAEEIPMRK